MGAPERGHHLSLGSLPVDLGVGREELVALGREMLSDPSWCYRAALALGIERPYDVLPQAFGFFLERRAAVLDA